ncbi:hypothetical protein DRH29_04045 [candidate division Kazan bacterium]|uniref:Uncharacterized protein n=1 Tax=candidate division Kazan bacterium TaxID=2202143 RepID=A0A420ZC25_UNCK3|nr:MAG: hypothetical protein DRH29_04045 [candidate division Kazan bacterium]
MQRVSAEFRQRRNWSVGDSSVRRPKSVENENKGSHMSGDRQVQVFMNSRSELVKGSHKSPYVTLSKACRPASKTPASEILQGAIQSDRPLARATRKWCFRGGEGFKSPAEAGFSLT